MTKPICQFRHYLAGNEPNSVLAKRNLASICQEQFDGKYELTEINVLENAEAAYHDSIFASPTLVAEIDDRRVVIVGNLNDRERACMALGIVFCS